MEIELTQGKVALIDDEDWELVSRYKWFTARLGWGRKYWYAMASVPSEATRRGKTTVMMHRLLLGAKGRTVHVDHINGDGLDNRRDNLRLATPAQNRRNSKRHANNTSGYKGVHISGNRWMAQITVNRVQHHLGYFDTPHEAALAYDEKARELHGEFARLNFA